ncbi:MAG: insulinase family protein [Bacilli bacterium]|nr:insulinase family protein [Bacilli bacterium]
MKTNLVKNKNYNLHTIHVDNFRSCHFSLVFRNKFNEKEAVAFTLLADLLTDVSKNYPSPKYVYRHIDSSYILNFYGSFSKVGKATQMYIICDYVDPKYIKEKDYLDNTYKFIFDMISNPLIINNAFDEKPFNAVKRRLLTELSSLKEDNNFLSVHKALKIFSNDGITSFNLLDMIDYINGITSEELYKFYLKLINNSSVDIFITSSTDENILNNVVKKYYPFKNTKNIKYEELVFNKKRLLPKKVVDKSSYKQSTIVMVFNIDNMTMFEREFVMPFYRSIINSGGLGSKLYVSLREKNSLCYNVSTSCYDRTNLLLINSTIKVGEENKAIRLIKKCVKDMVGRISNEEFVGAFYDYQRNLKGMVDSIGAINRLYMNMYYASFSSYEEKQISYKKVTIDDVNELAKKIHLNTIYVLKGDINERNQD